MFCKNCGRELSSDAKFCPACGAAQEPVFTTPAQPVEEKPAFAPVEEPATIAPEQSAIFSTPADPIAFPPVVEVPDADPREEEKNELAKNTLKNGIIGLAFSAATFLIACVPILSIIGLIFSGKAKRKANEYVALAGALEGKATVGRNLAKAGTIVGLIGLIGGVLFWLFYFSMFLFAILGTM